VSTNALLALLAPKYRLYSILVNLHKSCPESDILPMILLYIPSDCKRGLGDVVISQDNFITY